MNFVYADNRAKSILGMRCEEAIFCAKLRENYTQDNGLKRKLVSKMYVFDYRINLWHDANFRDISKPVRLVLSL